MDLAHERRGSGRPLLLLHGIGDRRETWLPVLDRLAARRDAIAIDLPGFGESPPLPPGAPPTIEALADAVEAFAQRLGVDDWDVAGNSMGGGASIVLAARGRVGSAVAIAPIGFGTARERAFLRTSLRANRRVARALAPVAGLLVATPVGRAFATGQMHAAGWRLEPQHLRARLEGLAHAPGYEPLLDPVVTWRPPPDVISPLTIAWGDRDRLLLSRQAERARRFYPHARHVTLRGTGHIPMGDDPEAVAEVLLAEPPGAPEPSRAALAPG